MKVGVLGATGRIGRQLARRLIRPGVDVVAIYRDPAKWPLLPADCEPRIINLDNARWSRETMADLDVAISCTPPSCIPELVLGLPELCQRVIILGSARRYTRVLPDAKAEAIRLAEITFDTRGLPGVILHPTMIYGAGGENNIGRIAEYIRRFGVVPLPGGGHSLIQPIHVQDVVACLEAAVFHPLAIGPPITIAGPAPVSWSEFVREVATSLERLVCIVPIPVPMMRCAAWLTRHLPGLSSVTDIQVRRLMEDKDFSIGPMQTRLGVTPRSLRNGLDPSQAQEREHGQIPPGQPRGESEERAGNFRQKGTAKEAASSPEVPRVRDLIQSGQAH